MSNFLGPIVVVSIGAGLGLAARVLSRRHSGRAGGAVDVVADSRADAGARSARSDAATPGQRRGVARGSRTQAAWKNRNVLLCIAMSILLVAFVVVFSIFMPLYLVNVRDLAQSVMAWLMSMFGLTSMFFAFLVPGSSDVLGRRPVVISMSLIGALLPLSALFVDQPLWLVFVLFALGAAISGVFPLAMATIPSETVPPQQLATVLGLTMGLGEIIGGVFSPDPRRLGCRCQGTAGRRCGF